MEGHIIPYVCRHRNRHGTRTLTTCEGNVCAVCQTLLCRVRNCYEMAAYAQSGDGLLLSWCEGHKGWSANWKPCVNRTRHCELVALGEALLQCKRCAPPGLSVPILASHRTGSQAPAALPPTESSGQAAAAGSSSLGNWEPRLQ